MNSVFSALLLPVSSFERLSLNGSELNALKQTASDFNLFTLLYSRLREYGDQYGDDPAIARFLGDNKNLYLNYVAHSILLEAAGNEIMSLLRKNGISAIIMRGYDIEKNIYHTSYVRSSVDIDILIKKEDALVVERIMDQAGFERDSSISLNYYLSRIHHAAYHNKSSNVTIEIHWHFGVPYFFHLSPEEIWKEIKENESGGVALSPELVLMMLLIHHHSHSFRELKILIDLLWAMNKYQREIDWEVFAERLEMAGLVKTTLITLGQFNQFWNERVKGLIPLEVLSNAFSQYRIPECLMNHFRINLKTGDHKEIYRDKFVARFSLDRRSTIFLSFIKTVFPVPEAIKGLYNDSRNWMLPLNYARFIKWRMKAWIGM